MGLRPSSSRATTDRPTLGQVGMVSFIFGIFHVYFSSKKRGGKRKERRKFASIWERLSNFATSIPPKIAAGAPEAQAGGRLTALRADHSGHICNNGWQPILEPSHTLADTPQPCDDPPVRPPTVRRPTNRTQTNKSNLGGPRGYWLKPGSSCGEHPVCRWHCTPRSSHDPAKATQAATKEHLLAILPAAVKVRKKGNRNV